MAKVWFFFSLRINFERILGRKVDFRLLACVLNLLPFGCHHGNLVYSVPYWMNMQAFMTFYHPILLHTRLTAEPKKSKLRHKFWETYTTLCHLDLLQRIQSLILSRHQREGRILLSVWLQQEADCYLITVLLFFTLLRCENLQTEPSHEPHRYDVALHYLFIHSILHAAFFFTFTGVINMIHSFNIGVLLIYDCLQRSEQGLC